MLEKSYIP